MSEIWMASDLHICHKKSFLWEPRGFSSVEEMNEAIVENWNRVVKPGDLVYNLGDIALSDTDAAIPYLQRLHGIQLWIRGNHDSENRVRKILIACPNIDLIGDLNTSWATIIKSGKWHFYLSHYPTKVGNYDDTKNHKLYCLCGHTHTKDKFCDIVDNCYHVEMDAHNCFPVNLEQIKDDLRECRENHL